MKKPILTVEVLKDANRLWTLENEFLHAVGEEPMDAERWQRLAEAVAAKKIIFFAARMDGQLIGMCSVSPCFSTFTCKTSGVFDDFFVRPEHRGHGVARRLVNAAQAWCTAHDYASLTVGCSREDAAMYQSLGFDTELGVMLANNL